MTNEPHSHITIKGSDLVSTYGVYIILIKDASDKPTHYYVGQTGDAKHISARSAFYRMAAHLGYSTSTQNQLFKAIKKLLLIKDDLDNREVRKQVEAWLKDKTLEIRFFKTADFEFLQEGKDEFPENYKIHTDKRQETIALETALLQELEKTTNLVRMNKSSMTYKDFEKAIPRAKEIIKTIGL
ncbi:MAG: hypothetical protein IT221_10370 [Fluviicola sp.]|nr:hypothetical protein [Fluviicola sp.]